jgi:hypothetical protein
MHADSPNGGWRVEGFRGYAGRLGGSMRAPRVPDHFIHEET